MMLASDGFKAYQKKNLRYIWLNGEKRTMRVSDGKLLPSQRNEGAKKHARQGSKLHWKG